jgi:hypothetical protein
MPNLHIISTVENNSCLLRRYNSHPRAKKFVSAAGLAPCKKFISLIKKFSQRNLAPVEM